MKLCVFPNDSLLSYLKKGEIKKKYFNPQNYFDEVHVISLFNEEADEDEVKQLAGQATLTIHKLGKVNLSNYKDFESKVTSLLNKIKPKIIRSYNPLVQGWLAVKAGKSLQIPVVISLHTNYDQQRSLTKESGKYFQYLKLLYTSKKLESYTIKNADSVICVYKYIIPYAKKMDPKNIHLIYNRVDLKQFSPEAKKEINPDKPTILSVGRLIQQKNHRYLIEAIKDLDSNLLLIGNGPNYSSLIDLAKKLEVDDKVKIIKRVSNEKLSGYYTACDIYVQPMEKLGGIPIPVMEAMACGLPIVMSKREPSHSEIIDDAIVFVDNTSDSFKKALTKILSDSQYKNSLKRKSLQLSKEIGGDIMESRELELYKSLIDNYQKKLDFDYKFLPKYK